MCPELFASLTKKRGTRYFLVSIRCFCIKLINYKIHLFHSVSFSRYDSAYSRHILMAFLIHDTIHCFSFSLVFFVFFKNKIPRSLPHLPMGYSHFPVKPTQQDVRLCGLVCKLRGVESFPASLSHWLDIKLAPTFDVLYHSSFFETLESEPSW